MLRKSAERKRNAMMAVEAEGAVATLAEDEEGSLPWLWRQLTSSRSDATLTFWVTQILGLLSPLAWCGDLVLCGIITFDVRLEKSSMGSSTFCFASRGQYSAYSTAMSVRWCDPCSGI